MRSWVVVAEHPFYAITNDQGEFSITNLPAGQYTLEVWHETLGDTTTEVTVTEAGNAKVTIDMQ